MLDERELAINPVVQESMMHNYRVIQLVPIHIQRPPRLTLSADCLQHPLPDCVPLWRCCWYPWSRILARLPLLRPRLSGRLSAHLLPSRQCPSKVLLPRARR
jgi:hypothetical protein